MCPALDYERFIIEVRGRIGLDLGSYKEQQMRRRIGQLMQRHGTEDYAEFLAMLDTQPALLEHFTNYLTINTSQFFRDPAVYKAIGEKILPALLQGGKALKIWSAGCSIGAEPYSLAILLLELAGEGSWRILATDFDRGALAKAREGRYQENMLSGLPSSYLARYFRAIAGEFSIDERVKTSVSFREHNLLTSRFERGFDLILCRNVFIYFTPQTQEQLIARFVDSLSIGGYFVVGCSEMVSYPSTFSLERVQPAIYRKVKELPAEKNSLTSGDGRNAPARVE